MGFDPWGQVTGRSGTGSGYGTVVSNPRSGTTANNAKPNFDFYYGILAYQHADAFARRPVPGVPNVEGDFWSYAVAVDANIEYRAAQIDVFFRLVALGQGHAAAYADQTDEIKRLQAKYKAEYQAIAIWAWALTHPDIPATPQPAKQTPPTTAPNVPSKPVPQSPKYELGDDDALIDGLWAGIKDLPSGSLEALQSALKLAWGVVVDQVKCGLGVADR